MQEADMHDQISDEEAYESKMGTQAVASLARLE